MNMTRYQKFFGSGPLGAVISIVFLLLFWWLDGFLHHPLLTDQVTFIRILGIFFILMGLGIHAWTFMTLRKWWVDNQLCQSGPFKYVRHPMYTGWIVFIVSGLSIYLNSWVFLMWPLAIHPIWHLLATQEEKILNELFGDEYRLYSEHIGRFIPKGFSMNRWLKKD